MSDTPFFVGAHDPVFVAGHRGLVGSAIVRALTARGHRALLTRTHAELDLADAETTDRFFAEHRPAFVVLAAAKVGGIHANDSYPADFIAQNLAIQHSVITAAWRHGVKRLLFLGSSCIYPKHAPQPLRETSLLAGPLEPTNRPYALAKIAGIEMCWSHNRQHGTRFLAAMPTNLYGPGDNYHAENSHVVPALIRKFHEAKMRGDVEVTVWGTGTPRREFLYADDMAQACLFLLGLDDPAFDRLLWPAGDAQLSSLRNLAPLVNIGVGEDLSIAQLARIVRAVVGFGGDIVFDSSKPDGTPRKLLDVSRLREMGWAAATPLQTGLAKAYADYLGSEQ